MKVLTGYLTQGNKKAIQAILAAELTVGRVGNTDYCLIAEKSVYSVTMVKMDRGFIPVPGSALRQSIYKATFTL